MSKGHTKCPKADIECIDCKEDLGQIHELFFVSSRAIKGDNRDKDLCIGCLETRLGRRLRPEEFPDCEVNTSPYIIRSHRLIDRMSWDTEYW